MPPPEFSVYSNFFHNISLFNIQYNLFVTMFIICYLYSPSNPPPLQYKLQEGKDISFESPLCRTVLLSTV